MKKGTEAFRSIGEVATLIGVAPHVLRYWETQFTLLKPMKRPDGRRYYRPDDVRLAAGLCEVLREEGLTIRGARKLLARDRGEAVRARGALRLDSLLGADLRDPAEDVAPAGVAVPAPPPSVVPHQQMPVETAEAGIPAASGNDAWEEEVLDMAGHAPRSRHRRRRHPSDDTMLPLFPDLSPDDDDRPWLGQLVSLSELLRDRAERLDDPAVRAQAQRLSDAISALSCS